jgi:heme exporter protein CcmD
MMGELGRHAGYILASYAAAAVILGALIVQSLAAHRRAKARLGAADSDHA